MDQSYFLLLFIASSSLISATLPSSFTIVQKNKTSDYPLSAASDIMPTGNYLGMTSLQSTKTKTNQYMLYFTNLLSLLSIRVKRGLLE